MQSHRINNSSQHKQLHYMLVERKKNYKFFILVTFTSIYIYGNISVANTQRQSDKQTEQIQNTD